MNVENLDRNLTGNPSVVGITGGSGSGKTTFAKRLCAWFGADAVILSHDDYYKSRPDMTVEEAAVYDFDCPEAFDTYLLVKHLNDLKANRSVKTPSYDFVTHTRTDGVCLVEPVPVIIVEGLLIMCDPELLGMLDLVIYMDADIDIAAQRRIERDCRERGADLPRALNMYFRIAKPAYEKYVEPFKRKADIIISDALSDQSLELVARGIRAFRE
jgi:uridine kinase